MGNAFAMTASLRKALVWGAAVVTAAMGVVLLLDPTVPHAVELTGVGLLAAAAGLVLLLA